MFSGKDCFVNVSNNGYLEMGHLALWAQKSTLIATNKIIFGTWTRIGSNSKVIDTNYHQMYDTETNERSSINGLTKLLQL